MVTGLSFLWGAALLFSAYYLVLCMVLRRGLSRLDSPSGAGDHTFSVVVAAHNEAANIRRCLAALFAQTLDPSRYEIILVDDRSSDGTGEIAASCACGPAGFTLLTVTSTPGGVSPKKHAVMQGITAARNEIVVITDADCIVPPRWLETHGHRYDRSTGLVQGITSYLRPAGISPLFFGLQAIDFVSHAVVSAAAIGSGIPLNSNANNLSFRKETFGDVGGYGKNRAVVSGDDDLLLQRVMKSGRWKVRYMADREGAVVTDPVLTPAALFEQRKRWGSKTVYYGPLQVALLSGVFGFYLLLMLVAGAAFFSRAAAVTAVVMLGVKVVSESIVMVAGMKLLGQEKLLPFLVPASLLQLPLVVGAVLCGVFGRFSWRGQQFRKRV